MITFSSNHSPNVRTSEVPQNKNDKAVYTMYLNDSSIGDTYGAVGDAFVISLFGQGHHMFHVSDIERVKNNDISLDELFNLGKIIN